MLHKVRSRLATLGVALFIAAFLFPSYAQFAHAATPLPDLIVTNITWTPAQPFSGDAVTFSATVKNQGDAPTPPDVVIGGVFFVDGSFVSYTDNYRTSLAPGDSVTLTANGGGSLGDGTWTATAGTHTISFLVDDVNRIAESNENNNSFTLPQPLVVQAENGPDLIVSQIGWIPPDLYNPAGKPVIFTATVTNRGTQPTPAGKTIGVQFTVDGQVISSDNTDRSVLNPGQSVTLVAGQPAGSGPWIATPGVHTVTATVDPTNQIAETRENNNTLTIQFAIGQDQTGSAKSSDSFVDTMGVGVHLSYLDTLYGQYDTVVKPLLQGLGIRYIRDGNPSIADKVNDLAKSGIKLNYIMNANVDPAQELSQIKPMRDALLSIEGPNEPNLFYKDQFPDQIRAYQNLLYQTVKADPTFAPLPVLAPALAFGSETAPILGPVSCDLGNLHSYEAYPLTHVQQDIAAAQLECPNKPVWATEMGYHTALKAGGVSEQAQEKYLLRTYLENFNLGIGKTFIYEFLDEKPEPALTDREQHFGIVRADGTPKPAYNALKNLIALLKDAGPSFTPGTLQYQINGNITNLHHTLLQKRDGTYELVLWLSVPSYNSGKDLNSSQPVTLQLGQRFGTVNTYDPSTSTNAVNSARYPNFVTLNVSDQPQVIELKA